MKVEIVREADLMGDMGMEDMAGGDTEVEGEAEVVDLEVVVAEDSEGDGDELWQLCIRLGVLGGNTDYL
jgi:hypothetical protein